jgi:hypothetical protein
MCLFALLLLSTVAFGLMFIANTETAVNYNYRSSMQARAGAQEGVDRLRQGVTGYSITPPIAMPSNSAVTGVVYIINNVSPDTRTAIHRRPAAPCTRQSI